MELELSGKVALVTGASRGIGKGIALGFAAEGCRLVIVARGRGDLDKTAQQISAMDVECLPLQVDITHKESADLILQQTLDRFGSLDILINNAGGSRKGSFETLSDEDWASILDLNLMAHVRMSRAVIPQMKKQMGGVIIFIASIYGRESGGPGRSIYNTTKSGVISVAKTMAEELASQNIRVNSVAPGSILFSGGGWDRRSKEDPERIAEFIKRELPMGRFGTVEEIADVVVFLSSKRAGLIAGACINVDGAQSRSLI